MISEFNSLSEKVGRLAALAQTLRQENADLRLQISGLNNTNEALVRRMDEAQRRIVALLDKLPELPLESEAAELEMAEEKAE